MSPFLAHLDTQIQELSKPYFTPLEDFQESILDKSAPAPFSSFHGSNLLLCSISFSRTNSRKIFLAAAYPRRCYR